MHLHVHKMHQRREKEHLSGNRVAGDCPGTYISYSHWNTSWKRSWKNNERHWGEGGLKWPGQVLGYVSAYTAKLNSPEILAGPGSEEITNFSAYVLENSIRIFQARRVMHLNCNFFFFVSIDTIFHRCCANSLCNLFSSFFFFFLDSKIIQFDEITMHSFTMRIIYVRHFSRSVRDALFHAKINGSLLWWIVRKNENSDKLFVETRSDVSSFHEIQDVHHDSWSTIGTRSGTSPLFSHLPTYLRGPF